jgi:CRP/FNR family transcriptional regulator
MRRDYMKRECERCNDNLCARKVGIFSNITNDELIDIISMTGHMEYDKDENIFLEGDKSDTLYIINEGKIKLFKITKSGKEQILHILSEGEFFGELNLIKAGEYHFNAKAVTPVRLCTLTNEDMKNIVLKRPEIGLKVLEVVGERLSKLETMVQTLATNDAEARLASLLIQLSEENGKRTSQGIEIKVPVSREDMSNLTGVARETISRKLKKLEDQGIIKIIGSRKIIILDEDELHDYV